MSLSTVSTSMMALAANNAVSNEISTYATDDAGYNVLGAVTSAVLDGNKVDLTTKLVKKFVLIIH